MKKEKMVILIMEMAQLLDDSRCKHTDVNVRTQYHLRKQRVLREAREVAEE